MVTDTVDELLEWAWYEFEKGNIFKADRILNVCRRLLFKARVFRKLPLVR